MIKRIWHGWTTPEHAGAYEALLRNKIFTGIARMGVEGYSGIELLRRDHEDEVEFITIMSFDSWTAVKAFAGGDGTESYVPDEARAVLKRWDRQSQHYEVRETLSY